MAMGAGTKSGGIKADINVTPLVDVVLVLLIIFMVITPMLQRGKDVQLPQAQKTEQQQRKDADPIILSVTPDGQLYLENEVLPKDRAVSDLGRLFASKPGRKVLLKGDKSLKVKAVREVMNLARTAGAKGVALGVQEEKN
jgi:biopolymer transport protein ExbD